MRRTLAELGMAMVRGLIHDRSRQPERAAPAEAAQPVAPRRSHPRLVTQALATLEANLVARPTTSKAAKAARGQFR